VRPIPLSADQPRHFLHGRREDRTFPRPALSSWSENVSTPPSDAPPLLEGVGITKSYGHVEALRGADFTLLPGEVVR
jgi:hypothetical protein